MVGPTRWAEDYEVLDQSARDRMSYATVRCTLRIQIGESWVARVDVGGAGNPDPLVALKGAYSDALKRAAVKMGVGRSLYGDGIPEYDEAEHDEPIQGQSHRDRPPSTPTPAPKSVSEQTKDRGQQGRFNVDRMPTSGKSLWAWCKALEEIGEEWAKGLAYRVKNHFKKEQFPEDLGHWTVEMVEEAIKYVEGLKDQPGEKPKPRKAPTGHQITYDLDGKRVTPLAMNEPLREIEVSDAKVKLIALATAGGTTELAIGQYICKLAGDDGKAPYLKNTEVDFTECQRQYALLKKHFPEWLLGANKAAVAAHKERWRANNAHAKGA